MNIINEIGKIVEETDYDISLSFHPGGELFIHVVDLRTNKSEFIVIGSDWKKHDIICAINNCIRRLKE